MGEAKNLNVFLKHKYISSEQITPFTLMQYHELKEIERKNCSSS